MAPSRGIVEAEQPIYKLCDVGSEKCPKYLLDWRSKLNLWSKDDEQAQLREVNDWINHQIKYTDDMIVYGVPDHWASPAESLKGRGDCKDYAIAKYASLKALGIPEENLRIVIVDDTRKNLGHAVLSVHTTQGVFILDNQNQLPVLDSGISYYNPIYSINASNRWINIAVRKLKTRLPDMDLVASNLGSDQAFTQSPITSAGSMGDDGELHLRPSFADADLTSHDRTPETVYEKATLNFDGDSGTSVAIMVSEFVSDFFGQLHGF